MEGLQVSVSVLLQEQHTDEAEYGEAEWYWQGVTELLLEKYVPVPLCLPQISHGLKWDKNRASSVRDRRLTAWDVARIFDVQNAF
jgi:hypothetical protein